MIRAPWKSRSSRKYWPLPTTSSHMGSLMALDIQHPRAKPGYSPLYGEVHRGPQPGPPTGPCVVLGGTFSVPCHLFRDINTATPRVTTRPPVCSTQVWVLFSAWAPGYQPSTWAESVPRPPTSPQHLPPGLSGRTACSEEQQAWAQPTEKNRDKGREDQGPACTQLPFLGAQQRSDQWRTTKPP